MRYISTRGGSKVDSAEAIRRGISPEGGLFVSEIIPEFSDIEMSEMSELSYGDLSVKVLSKFLSDYSLEEIEECVAEAYNKKNFDTSEITPLVEITENISILELWHGPTAAFKDMALQIMPHLLSKALDKNKITPKNKTLILVATSGDTGKAALEGFKDIKDIEIIVFYPNEGVSKVQELQMNTTDGSNTHVSSVYGNFDDCQTGVKAIFTDKDFEEHIKSKGYEFSSANSINWGRLMPQIIYYFKAYFTLLKRNEIKQGEKINFCVPTGNFGNILAGYYAKKMGLPIDKLICASNMNNILTDFINSGVYDRNRRFFKTTSPSMDILISSNLERFLFEITGHNHNKISNIYEQLKEIGRFQLDNETKNIMQDILIGGFAEEAEVFSTIKRVYSENKYLIDTHTAVAYCVAEKLNLNAKTVVMSTASPYKFGESVCQALSSTVFADEFEACEAIKKITKVKIHRAVKGLKQKEIIHKSKINISDMKDMIMAVIDKN